MRLFVLFQSLLLISASSVGFGAGTYDVAYLHPPGYSSSKIRASALGKLGGSGVLGGSERALLWPNADAQPLDLTPANSSGAIQALTMYDADASAGYVFNTGGLRAAVWEGTTPSPDIVHPTAFTGSIATGLSLNSVVGYAVNSDPFARRAVGFWTQSGGEGYFNLHPMGWYSSEATCADGFNDAYGYGQMMASSPVQALSFSSPTSFSVMTPPGYATAQIFGSHQSYRVGSVGLTTADQQAATWRNGVSTFRLLDPAGSQASVAYGTANWIHVGSATYSNLRRAALWHSTVQDTVTKYTDLHASLAPQYTESIAYASDQVTNTVGGMAFNSVESRWEAVAWKVHRTSNINESANLVQGSFVSGGLQEINFSDLTSCVIAPNFNVPRSEAPVQLILESTAPSEEPVSLGVWMRTAGGGGVQTVRLFNFDTSAYEVVASTPLTFNEALYFDAMVVNPERFVQPGTRKMRAKLDFMPPPNVSRSWNVKIEWFNLVTTH